METRTEPEVTDGQHDVATVHTPAKRTIGEALSTTPVGSGWMAAPRNFEETLALCAFIAKSELVPEQYQNKPADILIAVQMGAEVGLSPMAALQSIAVIGKRPSLWGDGFMAVIRKHPEFESCEEWLVGEGEEMEAHCRMIRRGQPSLERTYSVTDARLAGLWGKMTRSGAPTPWVTNPKRMLQMRARGFTGRDLFADALKGLALAEEQMDVPVREKNVTPQQPADAIPLDEADDRDKKITELVTQVKWTNARLEIEFRALGNDKDKLVGKLESERDRLAKAAEKPGGPGDRSSRRANQTKPEGTGAVTATAEPAATQPPPEQPPLHDAGGEGTALIAPVGDGTPVDDVVRKKLFAILNELGLEEKPKRMAWAFTFGVNVKSFTEIKGGNVWVWLADRAQEQLAEMKRSNAAPAENEIVNETGEKCIDCAAEPGEKHVLACPSAYRKPAAP